MALVTHSRGYVDNHQEKKSLAKQSIEFLFYPHEERLSSNRNHEQELTRMIINWNLKTPIVGIEDGMVTMENNMRVPQNANTNHYVIWQSCFWYVEIK